jgi:hypothetical protein
MSVTVEVLVLDALNGVVLMMWAVVAGSSIVLAFDTFTGGASTDEPVEQQILYYLHRILLVIAQFFAAFSVQQVLTQLSR